MQRRPIAPPGCGTEGCSACSSLAHSSAISHYRRAKRLHAVHRAGSVNTGPAVRRHMPKRLFDPPRRRVKVPVL